VSDKRFCLKLDCKLASNSLVFFYTLFTTQPQAHSYILGRHSGRRLVVTYCIKKITLHGDLGRDDPKQCDQIKIMPFIRTSLAQSENARPKANALYVYNVSLFLLACLLNKMATSKQCKVSIKGDQRLDHTTKLEASLSRQL